MSKIVNPLLAITLEALNHTIKLLDRVVKLMESSNACAGDATRLIILPGPTQDGKAVIMAATLKIKQFSQLTLVARDANGNTAQFQGAPEFTSSDETVVTVTQEGVMTAVAPGQGRVVATVDADLGEGIKPLVGTLDVTVVAGEAVVLEISAGTPQDPGGATS